MGTLQIFCDPSIRPIIQLDMNGSKSHSCGVSEMGMPCFPVRRRLFLVVSFHLLLFAVSHRKGYCVVKTNKTYRTRNYVGLVPNEGKCMFPPKILVLRRNSDNGRQAAKLVSAIKFKSMSVT